MSSPGRQLGLALLVVATAGCPSTSPPSDPGMDHTIAKLKQEQARQARESKVDPLAEAVVAPEKPEDLALPPTGPAKLGGATVKLTGLRRSQSVTGSKLTLTTADAFLRVELVITAGKAQTLSLSDVALHQGSQTYELATDAMRVGGGSPTRLELAPGEAKAIVLYFELPRDAVGKGLALTLPGGGAPSEVPLQ